MKDGAPCTTRTCDLLVRSQTLYPTELRARKGWRSALERPRPWCETTIICHGPEAGNIAADRVVGQFEVRRATEETRGNTGKHGETRTVHEDPSLSSGILSIKGSVGTSSQQYNRQVRVSAVFPRWLFKEVSRNLKLTHCPPAGRWPWRTIKAALRTRAPRKRARRRSYLDPGVSNGRSIPAPTFA